MHTAFELKKDMFAVTVAGQPADADMLLDWGERDRLGVVIDRPVGALGAGLLTLLVANSFFDVKGKKRRQRPLYPDMFLIHAGGPWGCFIAMDYWPDHKEVFVRDDPREVLRMINHLGITHLAVPDVPRRGVEHRFKEPEAARDRLKICFAYAPDGQAADADVTITTNSPVVIQNYNGVLYLKETMAGMLDEESAIPLRLRSPSPEDAALSFAVVNARLDEVSRDHPDYTAAAARFEQARNAAFMEERLRRISTDAALEMLGDPA